MLYDGSLFAYDKSAAIKVNVTVIAGTSDDINFKILLQARKGTAQVLSIPDITSMVITYPDGGRVMFSNGTIIGGPLADNLMTSGRKKGNTYSFVFGSFAGAQSPIELGATIFRAGVSALNI
jgi:Tol biopolymer transport system component